jgi:hypothetical protein
MSQCGYLYVNGLRVQNGEAMVTLDGERFAIIRDGQKFPDRDRRISIARLTPKALKKELDARGLTQIEVEVRSDESGVSYKAMFDPTSALGRKGRQGSYKDTMESMNPEDRMNAAIHQLETLPYSAKAGKKEASARLDHALSVVGINNAAHQGLLSRERFWKLASDDAFNAANEVVGLLEHPHRIATRGVPEGSTYWAALAIRNSSMPRLQALVASHGGAPLHIDMVAPLVRRDHSLVSDEQLAGVLKNNASLSQAERKSRAATIATVISHTSHRMTDAQLDQVLKSYTPLATSYRPEPRLLQMAYSGDYALATVVSAFKHRLSSEQLDQIVSIGPFWCVPALVDVFSDEQLDRIAENFKDPIGVQSKWEWETRNNRFSGWVWSSEGEQKERLERHGFNLDHDYYYNNPPERETPTRTAEENALYESQLADMHRQAAEAHAQREARLLAKADQDRAEILESSVRSRAAEALSEAGLPDRLLHVVESYVYQDEGYKSSLETHWKSDEASLGERFAMEHIVDELTRTHALSILRSKSPVSPERLAWALSKEEIIDRTTYPYDDPTTINTEGTSWLKGDDDEGEDFSDEDFSDDPDAEWDAVIRSLE